MIIFETKRNVENGPNQGRDHLTCPAGPGHESMMVLNVPYAWQGRMKQGSEYT